MVILGENFHGDSWQILPMGLAGNPHDGELPRFHGAGKCVRNHGTVSCHDSTRCSVPYNAWHGKAAMKSHDGEDMGIHGKYCACCGGAVYRCIVGVHLGITRVALTHTRRAARQQHAYGTSAHVVRNQINPTA